MKGSRRKTTQLTLFSSMKRITKTSTADTSKKGKAQIGNRAPVFPIVAEIRSSSTSHLSEAKVSESSCIDDSDDFQEDVLIDINSLKDHSQLFVEANAIGVDSFSEDLVSENSKEGVLCPLSIEGTANQKITKGDVKPQILDYMNYTSQALDVEDTSDFLKDVKAEPFEMTRADHVKFEELCICTCHFSSVNSRCLDTPESVHSLLDENDDGASVLTDGAVGDDPFRDSSIVIGNINTRIVGRKFSTGAVCEEGMQLAFVRDAENPKDSNAVKVRGTEWTLL